MKKLILSALALLFCFTQRAHATWAEFGAQETWPAFRIATDGSALKYRVMRLSAAGVVNVASNAVSADAFEMPIGILQNNPSSGRAATVAYEGMSKAYCGATVNPGELVTTDGSGMVIEAVSGNIVIGKSIDTVAIPVNNYVTVQLMPPYRAGSVA